MTWSGTSIVFLHSGFDDVRVDAGHSVDSMGSNNAQMGHVDLLLVSFLNQRHAAQTIVVPREDLSDALRVEEDKIPLQCHHTFFLNVRVIYCS